MLFGLTAMEVTWPLTSMPAWRGLGPMGVQTVPLRLIGPPPASHLHPMLLAWPPDRRADCSRPGPWETSQQSREADSTARAQGHITPAWAVNLRETGVLQFRCARHCLYHSRIRGRGLRHVHARGRDRIRPGDGDAAWT